MFALNDDQIKYFISIGSWLVVNFIINHQPNIDLVDTCLEKLDQFVCYINTNHRLPPEGLRDLNLFITKNGGNKEFSDIDDVFFDDNIIH